MVEYLESRPDLSEARASRLAGEYRATWRRYGSARELNSTIENYAFLSSVLKGLEARKDLSEFLVKITLALDTISR